MPSGREGVSSVEEDLSAAEAGKTVSSAEEDLTTAEVEIVVSSEDLFAAEAEVLSEDTLDILFLRGGSWSPGTRGELSRLRYCSAGERLNICERMPSSMGEREGRRPAEGTLLGVFLLALVLLPLALIWFFGMYPAGQRGRVQWNSGRPELSVNKVSAVRQS